MKVSDLPRPDKIVSHVYYVYYSMYMQYIYNIASCVIIVGLLGGDLEGWWFEHSVIVAGLLVSRGCQMFPSLGYLCSKNGVV